ncbi:Crp/Fnr family transcriptional regulator [Clostridium uliginosum]|uniref:cAMP-binding domain of CRP or a regulatory subunit of cAMP-dependent protein kinases n=1 Tax=Clostridium uliginosum TaxID=119641 RepID=A0A1I1I7F7_9CLOT|nr:Crp/Fnr family transcriptional regulator [Clostridium uliginosum]SFC30178.1 cAMP-binding domain of CRP or a regulatory subunit of cAMP-dependent protein kinases [Clostridium uliginosum]
MGYREEELRKLKIFSEISDKSIYLIYKHGKIKKYMAGSMIFLDKERINLIYVVMSGAVSLYKVNENGQKKVLFILDKGKIINEVIVEDITESINCEVFEEAEILEIYRDTFIDIMESDFQLTKAVIDSLSNKVRRMYRQLKNTSSSIKIEKKLVAKIYKLGKDYGISCDDGTMIDMNISITYLADLLGSQRETVSRAIKILQNKKLFYYKDKRIFIPDLQKLSDYFKTS